VAAGWAAGNIAWIGNSNEKTLHRKCLPLRRRGMASGMAGNAGESGEMGDKGSRAGTIKGRKWKRKVTTHQRWRCST
jgi:hypothetical protein